MDFLLDSHKNTSFVETVSDHNLKCWKFFLFTFFFFNTDIRKPMRLEGILIFTKGTKNLEMRSANFCTRALVIWAELWLVWGSHDGGYGRWDHLERANCNNVRWDHHFGVSDSPYGYESLWGQATAGLKIFFFFFFCCCFSLIKGSLCI